MMKFVFDGVENIVREGKNKAENKHSFSFTGTPPIAFAFADDNSNIV